VNDYKFTIKRQWVEFCERVGIPENQMRPDQRREMRRAFYGAWGQALIHFRDEIGAQDENKAVKIMEGQLKEVADFWLAEQGKQN
jgi:hypothetical protein